MTTPYHARYFAHELTRQRQPLGVDRLSIALFDACVNRHPHQIDAAAIALRSPLAKGVLLADEVGLGKKQDYNTKEMVYDLFDVNRDNNLENLRRSDQTWKVRLIEEEFQRLMFDVQAV